MTDPDLDSKKRALRREVRRRLKELPRSELEHAGQVVAAPLAAWLHHQVPPGPVALFAARPTELDTRALDAALRASGRVRLLPVIESDHLVFRAVPPDVAASDLPLDPLGIPTPPSSAPAVPLVAAALVVVPACAVDLHGRRLGWGKGFYDRALAARCVGGRALGTVALVHDSQVVDEVPVGPDDVLVERLCTPRRGLCALP